MASDIFEKFQKMVNFGKYRQFFMKKKVKNDHFFALFALFFQLFRKIDFCSKTLKNMFFELLIAFWAKKKSQIFGKFFFLDHQLGPISTFFRFFFLVFFLFFFNLWFSILKFFSKLFKISEIANLGSKHVFSERFGPKKCQEQKLAHFRSGRKKEKKSEKYQKSMSVLGTLILTAVGGTVAQNFDFFSTSFRLLSTLSTVTL